MIKAVSYILIILLAFSSLSSYGAQSIVVELSMEEENFLSERNSISMCVATDFMPHEDIVDGEYIGMASEYVDLISERLKIPFQLVETDNWQETIEYMKQRHCDVIPLLRETPDRLKYMKFSVPYYEVPLVIATKDDKPYVISIEKILPYPVGVVRGYAQVELLSKKYPNINIVEVDSAEDGINKLYKGQIYAFLGGLDMIGYHIQKSKYRNLKINGTMNNDLMLSMGSRNDLPILNNILTKAIQSISEEDRNRIKNSWVKVEYERRFDYTTLFLISLIAVLCLAFVIYHYMILKRHNYMLEALSETDKLTGLNNRLKLDRFLQFHLDLFERHHEFFSVILIDIDHFKRFNDQFGHLIGDKVLAHVASILKENCRKLDMVGRWGGEEFLVICPKTNLQEANVLAETLRNLVEQEHMENVDGVTISLGVAQIKISDNINTIISRADKALFLAKENGRNRIEISE